MDWLIYIIAFFAAICVGITVLVKKLGVKKSPYLIFGVVDVVLGILILIFALIDFKVSVGEFAGFFGQLALIIGEPIVGGLLLIDIIVWLVNRKKQIITQ